MARVKCFPSVPNPGPGAWSLEVASHAFYGSCTDPALLFFSARCRSWRSLTGAKNAAVHALLTVGSHRFLILSSEASVPRTFAGKARAS